jgi:exo-poly-alpha-galacturonosidase
VTNLRLTGSGNVNGGPWVSGNLTTLGTNMASAHGDSSRADLVNLNSVTGLYMRGLHFQDPPMHVIFVSRSTNVSVEGITSNSYRGCDSCIHNGDGIDLATSTGGYIFGSSFDDGDDCINLNAGTNLPGVTENRPDQTIRIFDNTTLHGHGGVVFGSLTAAWIKNILAEDNYHNGTDVGLRFKTGTNRGGGAGGTSSMSDGVTLRDIKLNNIKQTGIEMTGSYPDSTGFASAGVGFFRWITITNVTGSIASGAYAIKISGNPSPRHTNLTFNTVNITGSSGQGISVYQVSNSTFTNVTASSGNFFIEPGSWGDTFTSCSPTPTPH